MEVEPILTALALALATIAACTDARTGRIPNVLTLPILALVPIVLGAALGPRALALTLAGALACALVPLVLFARGAMGGGDVKLLAALGALLGPTRGLEVELVAVALVCGIALARWAWTGRLRTTLLALLRTALRPHEPRPHERRPHVAKHRPEDDPLRAEIRFAIPLLVALVWVLAG